MKWYEGLVHREVRCMNTLQTNDWLILNSIIYEIYTTADFDQMRRKFLEQMKMLVDFDSADFYLASSGRNTILRLRLHIIAMRIYRRFMTVLITAEGLCTVGRVSYIVRQILFLMI